VTEDLEYCRAIESYLCRKNDGHLIRIVGPAFELVSGWADRGVPVTIACRGIDRYFERYYAKGPRRRPVRVEFCEADVLDAFDEWRRAVGVSVAREHSDDGSDEEAGESAGPSRRSLPAHLDRLLARLASAPVSGDELGRVLAAALGEIEEMRSRSRGARGAVRQTMIERLTALDAGLIAAARAALTDQALDACRVEADAELASFRPRMSSDAYRRAREACVDRLVRERAGLAVLTFE
jgi:hypothetical protein